jgi:tetratricopeptide (TPR) repeat protein
VISSKEEMADSEHNLYGEGPSHPLLHNHSSSNNGNLRSFHKRLGKAEREKDLGRCLTICCEVLKISPDSSEFLVKKASYLVEANRYYEANEILGKVLKDNPQNAEALATLGLIFYNQGNLQKCVEVFGNALQIDENLSKTKLLRHKALRLIKIFQQSKFEERVSFDQQIFPRINFSNLSSKHQLAQR